LCPPLLSLGSCFFSFSRPFDFGPNAVQIGAPGAGFGIGPERGDGRRDFPSIPRSVGPNRGQTTFRQGN